MTINYGRWCEMRPDVLLLGGAWYRRVAYDDAVGAWVAGNFVRPLTPTELLEFERACGA